MMSKLERHVLIQLATRIRREARNDRELLEKTMRLAKLDARAKGGFSEDRVRFIARVAVGEIP
jgi:hypothetical protein